MMPTATSVTHDGTGISTIWWLPRPSVRSGQPVELEETSDDFRHFVTDIPQERTDHTPFHNAQYTLSHTEGAKEHPYDTGSTRNSKQQRIIEAQRDRKICLRGCGVQQQP
jgi:hypothetical protein